ncbi:SIR2 family protein [Methanosarcina sp.]|uniref:nSTAND3 domain-containing NTPase n=1 Tax=Methanosarcina sp. TaxID=2213 RepID=UPI0029886E89|nr:SIR2 family protein [Methanosarcina sp.]MDW5550506.1 SIR2 family protein [Methanosarcina sp.]MDW5554211.1 SIR2 family protein [Methanosarcina sp.]MDW5559571.1 SIR2 family protein [Methanosarcina sp.]
MSDSIIALASSMVSRKMSGIDPYILFLGAGASISSGCSSMMQIVDDVLKHYTNSEFEKWEHEIESATQIEEKFGELLRESKNKEKRTRFFEIWSLLDHDTQYSILRKHLWENKIPSEGYQSLVKLIKRGFIKTVLSTNLDNLMEKALSNSGYQPGDFVIVVNGKDRPEEIVDQLNSPRNPLKIVKLHGTLESPRSYAFRQEEIFDFEKKIKSDLSQLINQSLIIIGYSGQDRDVDLLFEDEGNEIYFVKPSKPEVESRISQTLTVRGKGKIIDGNDGKFDTFFDKLLKYIELEEGRSNASDSEPSIEGFLRNIGFAKELENPRSRYKNLTSLYVKPTEYNGICSKLENDHIIFIIGEPHLGKTYTAIYLLWEYYQKDYETLHIRHDNLITLLHENEGSLKKLLLFLISSKQGNPVIIHFDDPFGETMERRTDEFAKGLSEFLILSKQYEHLRIIVTTRLNIFREALAEQDCQDIEGLEKDLRVHTSYKSEVLVDILHRYTQFYKPFWSTDKEIVQRLDEKLPEKLPAPHNIEFFVRTSERLTSLEEVLQHVDKSKEMIRALGEWMVSLSAHEQIFLLWVEIQSTSNILFTNDSASKINLEAAYRETLAFLYKKEQISSIPPSSYSVSRDKFNMILLESRDGDFKVDRFDFIHPSYHEAFWYAIRESSRLDHWWKILKEKSEEILADLDNKLDRVQLRMIENYGTVNRDLDKLLLISAESEDVSEKAIALEHMMERIEMFAESPLFLSCVEASISSKKPKHRMLLINLLSRYFNTLPLRIIDNSMLLLVDKETDIQKKYLKIYFENINIINKFRTNPEFEIGILIEKLHLAAILSEYLGPREIINPKEIDAKLVNKFLQITLTEFEMLFKNNLSLGDDLIRLAHKDRHGKYINQNLTRKQIQNLRRIENYIYKNFGKSFPIYNDTRWEKISEI